MRFRLCRLVSVLLKEYRHILREPRTLWMLFLSPAFVLVALSLLFASGSDHVDLAVWDHDRSPMSREFTSNLDSNTDFSVTYVDGYEEIEELLVNQRIDAAVVIPAGFGDTVREQGAGARFGQTVSGLQENGALANPRVSANEDRRSESGASSQNAVEFTDAGHEAGGVHGSDFRNGRGRARCGSGFVRRWR